MSHSRRVSPSARLVEQTCRLFRLFIPFPRLQVRIGGFSSHARSLTPTRCLFRRREGSNKRAANAVRSSPGMSVQPNILIFVLAPPPWWDVGYSAHEEAKPVHVVFS